MTRVTQSEVQWVTRHESSLRQGLPDDGELEWAESDLTHCELMNLKSRNLISQHAEGHWTVEKRLYDWLGMDIIDPEDAEDVEDEDNEQDVEHEWEDAIDDDGQLALNEWVPGIDEHTPVERNDPTGLVNADAGRQREIAEVL